MTEEQDDTRARQDIDPASGWFSSMMESVVDTGENALSSTAASFREGFADTVSTLTTNLVQTDFYRNNFAYVPPPEELPSPAKIEMPVTLTATDGMPLNGGNDIAPAGAPVLPKSAANGTSSGHEHVMEAVLDEHSLTQQQVVINKKSKRIMSVLNMKEDVLNQIEEVSLEERLKAAVQSIGFVRLTIKDTRKLSVDGTRTQGTTHPYIKVRLGPYQNWTSPVAKEDAQSAGTFHFNKEITLVAQDISTDLVLEVRQKNVLVSDTSIGQVLVPLTSIIPNIRRAMKERSKVYTLRSWFELFPLKSGRTKFRPASSDIAETGMWKTFPSLGYLELDIELHLHSRISMWAGYAMPPIEQFMDIPKNRVPTGDLKAISAIVETGRGFKRNFQRVKTAFSRLFSRGKHTWKPLKTLRRARTFESAQLSLFTIFFSAYVCLWSPPYLLPVNIYLGLLISTYQGGLLLDGKENEKREYVVWNQEVRDPDDELGGIQKVAKVIYLLEKFERWMGVAADTMERMIHVFSFADERVTVAALLTLLVLVVSASIVLYFLSPGYICFGLFMAWFWKPSFTPKRRGHHSDSSMTDQAENQDEPSPKLKAIPMEDLMEEMETLAFRLDDDDTTKDRLTRALSVIKLMSKSPTLARNVFARVPTEDELGHRWICDLQRVSGDPPEEEDDNLASTSSLPNDGIWLHEM